MRNRAALAERIEAITTTEHARSTGSSAFDAADIPCGPINNYAEAFADPQIRAREMVVEVDHPTLGRLRTLGSPVKMSDTPPVVGAARAAARRAHATTCCAKRATRTRKSRSCDGLDAGAGGSL